MEEDFMVYDADALLSVLSICDGRETIYIQTPIESYVINGYEFDEDGDLILLTEKLNDGSCF